MKKDLYPIKVISDKAPTHYLPFYVNYMKQNLSASALSITLYHEWGVKHFDVAHIYFENEKKAAFFLLRWS